MKLFYGIVLGMFALSSVSTSFGQSVIIGETTNPPATTSYLYGPYYRSSTASTFDYSRYEYLYTASELNIPVGSIITKISWYKEEGTITGSNVFDIWLDNSTATSLTSDTWSNLLGNATQVYASTTHSFTAGNDSWEEVTLTTPFIYAGNALKVFTAHEMTGSATAGNYYYVNDAAGMALGYATSTPITGSTTLNTTSYGNKRPTIKITYIPGTNDNLGVDSLLSPSDSMFCSYESKDIKVRVRNFGANTVSDFEVHWSVNGVLQAPYTYNGNPLPNAAHPDSNFVELVIGTYSFPFNINRDFKIWTAVPNGNSDEDASNDTLQSTIFSAMEGVITNIIPGDTAICAGSSVILDAGQQPAGSIFIWNNGAITQQTAVSQPGSYNVTVQSPQGCFAYDTVTITQRPQPIAGDFGIVDEGGNNFKFTPVNMQNVTNYHWDFGDGDTLNVSTDAPQTHHYAQTGTYAVSLTVSNVCGAIPINKQIYVQPSMGIGELADVAKVLKVYPNPANDKLNIRTQVANIQLESVSIYNMLGKRVFVQKLKGAAVQLSLAQFPTGIYQVRIQTTKGFANSKIEIVR